VEGQGLERSMFVDLDDGGDDVAWPVQDVCPLDSRAISLWVLTVQCSDLQGDRRAGGHVGRHVDFGLTDSIARVSETRTER
jgi:hypothetical protein